MDLIIVTRARALQPLIISSSSLSSLSSLSWHEVIHLNSDHSKQTLIQTSSLLAQLTISNALSYNLIDRSGEWGYFGFNRLMTMTTHLTLITW